jgi:anti-sigma regulatory factor (Ser/Thr protein kinase)
VIGVQGISHPSFGGETVSHLTLAPLPHAVFWARRYTYAVLRGWQLQTKDVDTARLCVSELVTNAVKFTAPRPAHVIYSIMPDLMPISLILRHRSDTLTIEVCDPDPTPPVPAEADLDAEAGRGLMLIRAVSKEWDFYLPPSGGKVVYCVISARRCFGYDPAE